MPMFNIFTQSSPFFLNPHMYGYWNLPKILISDRKKLTDSVSYTLSIAIHIFPVVKNCNVKNKPFSS